MLALPSKGSRANTLLGRRKLELGSEEALSAADAGPLAALSAGGTEQLAAQEPGATARALVTAYGIHLATAVAIAAAGPDVVAATLRVSRMAAGQGSSEAVAGLAATLTGQTSALTTTRSPAATVPTSASVASDSGASPGGGTGPVGAPDTLLLGGPGATLFPNYGMPPAPRPFFATAFLRGMSPCPSTVAAARQRP
jgi:hypothetical protein